MSEWPDYDRVKRSLSRSWLRARVLVYLYDRRKCYCRVGEISRSLGARRSSVQGVLKGDGAIYPVEDSLVSLGLVRYEEVSYRRVKEYYWLTPQGENVARLLRKNRNNAYWR